MVLNRLSWGIKFLSTPSARRATPTGLHPAVTQSNFYPRPPRGGRRLHWNSVGRRSKFLSTPSARRATFCFGCIGMEERNFYPRPPRGGRRRKQYILEVTKIFLSTPSARRATPRDFAEHQQNTISIHALREEGDSKNREKIPAFIPL